MVRSVNLIQKILEEYREKTNEIANMYIYKKYTALHVACKRGHTEIVKALLHSLETCDQKAIHCVLLMQEENVIGGLVQKVP